MSYQNNGSGAAVLEENNYYPFGLKHEGYNSTSGNPYYRYQYNGKELQDDTGMLDYGWGQYMPELGIYFLVSIILIIMKKYIMKVILIKRLILFLILSIIFVNGIPILTDIYLRTPLYTGITLLASILFCFFIGKRILQKELEVTIKDDMLYIDKKSFNLDELKSYKFDNTGYIYKASLYFATEKIRLYVFIKQSGQYLELKRDVEKRIRFLNRTQGKEITKKDWYKTKFAKVYGYITIAILVLWIIIMFIYIEKFKLSNLGLFLMVAGGLSPILFKIFGRK
ncbi:hypothetical protein [Chryseobacterium indologenes]|uniref:Uncharacterized protein n=1 Tax=Chryseobacterium indologenes TaxID=253 RepID=A0A0N0ITS8_CHRID|nr:hypothetical protein [Chryseobacterium indologenes]KPE48994.1 hypothetical protein AOB46_22405 [Chryseobacterium indologenes]